MHPRRADGLYFAIPVRSPRLFGRGVAVLNVVLCYPHARFSVADTAIHYEHHLNAIRWAVVAGRRDGPAFRSTFTLVRLTPLTASNIAQWLQAHRARAEARAGGAGLWEQ